MQERTTKYTSLVHKCLETEGHATNMTILQHVQRAYPSVSATTIHRITSRMVERGELTLAPATNNNSLRFDARLSPHDHFQCLRCDCLRDMDIPQEIITSLQKSTGDCRFTGRLNIQGICADCLRKES
jgi:Fur family transcriptional regulator, peroxide stress response regulator